PSHKGYQNTIELPDGNNVVPLRSDTIRLVQNGCSFHELQFEDPNQHLKDFLKLVDSLDLDVANREKTHLHLFQFSLRDQASNWLERLLVGSISTWEDLTARFLAQFFPLGRTSKIQNNILMFQQHQGEPSINWPVVSYLSKTSKNLGHYYEDLTLYDNESWNDPRDFAKPVKAISLPQDVPSTSDRRLIKLQNQVQRLMEAHLASKSPVQVNMIASLCEICSGPHDTQYCMENPEQAFVDYASSCTNKAGGKWFTFRPEQNNLGDTSNPSWKVIQTLGRYDVSMLALHKKPRIFIRRIQKTSIRQLGKNRFEFIQGEMHEKMKDLGLFTLPRGLGDSKPFDTLADLRFPTPYYAKKDFMDYHLHGEWQIAKDAELNPFKDVLVFRKMATKEEDGAWHIRIELIDPAEKKSKNPSINSNH
ncbi:MAK10-like protein, partial [Tanacetum coccineum]